MNPSPQIQHDQTEQRAASRPENTVKCPSCASSHVEQVEPVEFGRAPFVWHKPELTYAVYTYCCQTCGAEFITGTTEHYHRRHHEARTPVFH